MSRLIWNTTGDYIGLEPCNHQFYEYFVCELNRHNINNYKVYDLGFAELRDRLLANFETFKNFMRSKLRSDAFEFDIDPSDQSDLNRLHRAWVKYQQQHSNVTKLFDRQIIDDINVAIHDIEGLTFKIELTTPNPAKCFPNIFGNSILGHGVYNLIVDFNNLGRFSFNKWQHSDPVNDSDTNNFEEVYTTLILRASPSEEHPLPKKYQDWCEKHDIECVGSCLPLANFDNLEENLVKYRQLILTNSLVKNNFIVLE